MESQTFSRSYNYYDLKNPIKLDNDGYPNQNWVISSYMFYRDEDSISLFITNKDYPDLILIKTYNLNTGIPERGFSDIDGVNINLSLHDKHILIKSAINNEESEKSPTPLTTE